MSTITIPFKGYFGNTAVIIANVNYGKPPALIAEQEDKLPIVNFVLFAKFLFLHHKPVDNVGTSPGSSQSKLIISKTL